MMVKKKNPVKTSSFGFAGHGKLEPLTKSEFDAAISFYNNEKKGKISASSIHARLKALGVQIKMEEIQSMMGILETISKEDFHKLVAESDVPKFDPVEEAFSLVCCKVRGLIDKETLAAMMKNLGHGGKKQDTAEGQRC